MTKAPMNALTGSMLLLAGVWGCTDGDGASSGGDVLRNTYGDTTEVRSLGVGAWGEEVSLVEELVIGALEGEDEYQFGMVTDIAVDDAGGVYVFDGQAPALRHYDAMGNFVRTLGGPGQGPGEYQDASLGMAIRRSDGRLVMRDPRNMRLNVYEPDGSSSDSWRVASGLFTAQATALDDADHMYLRIMVGQPEPNKPWPIALLHMDDRGQIVDTVLPPRLPNEPDGPTGSFTPSKIWAVARDGGILVGVNDRYVVDHYRADGTVLRMVREVPRPRVVPEEKVEIEARNDWMRRTQGQFMTSELPPVPDVKPSFRVVSVGLDGRVWVLRHVEAEKGVAVQAAARPGMEAPPPTSWREPLVYDVFESDGAFLGSVRVPPRTTLSVFRGEHVWGTRRGEFDEMYVVRLRIERS